MKPRILILSVAYAPHWGGAELAIRHITDRLSSQFDFYMLTARMDADSLSRERVGGVDVERLGFFKDSPSKQGLSLIENLWGKLFYIPFAVRRFSQLQKEQSFDLVWAVLESYAGIAGMFIKKKYPSVPYVLTLQSGDSAAFWKLRTSWWQPLYRKVYVVPDQVTAISHFLADQAHAHGRTGPITVVSNGVDIKNFQFPISNFQKDELKHKLGILSSDQIVITTSRLVYKNGIDILIKAMKRLPEHVKLLIVGSGKLEQKLKTLVEKLKLSGRVIFAGKVSHDELPQYLALADVFVRPSRSEGLGISFLEAMAAGVPVVGTPVGGIPDFLKDGETGLLCRMDDAEDIAQKIRRVLSDDLLRGRIVENGRKLIEEKYRWDTVAAQMSKVFMSFLA